MNELFPFLSPEVMIMDIQRLEKNLCDNILEAQIKLGYDGRPMSLNYTTSSLCHLTGITADDTETMLSKFSEKVSPRLGEITFRPIKDGYCLTVPSEGTEYVNRNSDGSEFIRKFIELIRSHPTVEEVLRLFRSFSDNVTVSEVNNEEFRYLVYFTDGIPDDYRYCISAEEEMDGSIHVTYHRFIKEDYDALGF